MRRTTSNVDELYCLPRRFSSTTSLTHERISPRTRIYEYRRACTRKGTLGARWHVLSTALDLDLRKFLPSPSPSSNTRILKYSNFQGLKASRSSPPMPEAPLNPSIISSPPDPPTGYSARSPQHAIEYIEYIVLIVLIVLDQAQPAYSRWSSSELHGPVV